MLAAGAHAYTLLHAPGAAGAGASSAAGGAASGAASGAAGLAGPGGDSSTTERLALGEDGELGGAEGCSSDAGSAAGDSDSEYISPNRPICEHASSWASLTAGLLARVMGVLSAGGALGAMAPLMRCVCRHWRSVVDVHLECLSPNVMKVRGLLCPSPTRNSRHGWGVWPCGRAIGGLRRGG